MPSALDAVQSLRSALSETALPLDAKAAATRDAAVHQIDDYVAPRLEHLDAPLLAVVGGSTGSGKSTLVNALVGQEISPSGVIRPTTRQPVLVCNPVDESWFASPRVLPGLGRVRGGGDRTSTTTVRILPTPSVPAGLALVDAPDFDSIDDDNRTLASQLLAAADLWVFVTTPARYADALPWQFLRDAASRDIEVMVVLNRVDEEAKQTVPAQLQTMLASAGLEGARLFVVDAAPRLEGLLPEQYVAELRGYLGQLAENQAARRALAGRTLIGAVGQLEGRVEIIAAARERHEQHAAQIERLIAEHYAEATREVIGATSDGQLLRDEVLSRWQDIVGTGDMSRQFERWFSRTVDRIGNFFTGKPQPMTEVETEIEHGLHAVVVDAAHSAAARTWSALNTQAPLLREQYRAQAGGDALGRASGQIGDRAARLVREWQADLVQNIQDSAGDKRRQARVASFGLNAVTVALMVVVFASTGGLTGGEVAIAGGSAVVGQKLLETIFGEDAVRRMAQAAREDLDVRVQELMAEEASRYDELLDPVRGGTSSGELRQAAALATREVAAEAGA